MGVCGLVALALKLIAGKLAEAPVGREDATGFHYFAEAPRSRNSKLPMAGKLTPTVGTLF